MTSPLLLVLDGNSLLHRAYHAATVSEVRPDGGPPVWAIKGLIGYAARAAARLRPDAVLVGFDCPERSARREDYPGYKAQRSPKAADLAEQIALAPELLRAAGLMTVVPAAYEADDVLASGAERARQAGWRAVLMTSDRDAFALIDATTSVLRVRNGGFDQAVIVTPSALVDGYGVEPAQYRDYAALRGDPSDNLRGVPGFGSATAARLLAAFGSLDAAWVAWDRGDQQAVRDAVGDRCAEQLGSAAARDAVVRNRRLMAMRHDLPIPHPDTLRLPLNRAVMRRVLIEHGIVLGPSLWALVGGTPPRYDRDSAQVPKQWTPKRGRWDPMPGQLALF